MDVSRETFYNLIIFYIFADMKYYAGIGSRQTPLEILQVMQQLASRLAVCGYCLRSGRAIGADTAFEDGCIAGNGVHELFVASDATNNARAIAMKHHPKWSSCKPYVRNLHGRNAMIILGAELDTPVSFVICWTPDGLDSGGTGLAMRIAAKYNIRIINLHDQYWLDRVTSYIGGQNVN